MTKLLPLLVLTASAALTAQSPLVSGKALTSIFPLEIDTVIFSNLVVANQITLQSLDIPLNEANGVTGTIEIWMTDGLTPQTQTYDANLFNQAVWTQMGSGSLTVDGLVSNVCLTPAVVLNPGSYGFAIVHRDLTPFYSTDVTPVANADITLTGGAIMGTPWVGPTLFQPRSFGGNFYYFDGGTAPVACGTPASHTAYGEGCFRSRTSAWELMTAAEANAMSGNVVSLLPGPDNYVLFSNIGIASYNVPTAGATALAGFAPDGDDGEVTFNLGADTFTPSDGVAVSDLFVHTNGMASTQGIEAFLIAELGVSFAPFAPALVDAPGEIYSLWHDFNLLEGGSVVTEVVAGYLNITWLDVESYPDGTANPSTIQMQFELNTGTTPGIVHLISQDVTDVQVGAASDQHLPGYSSAGDSETQIAVDWDALPVAGLELSDVDAFPLTLFADARPVIGSRVNYETTNWSAPGAASVGVQFVSETQFAPGTLDLFGVGLTSAAGCELLLDTVTGAGFVITSNAPIYSFTMPVDPNIVGAVVHSQSFELDLFFGGPLVTTASNGLTTIVGGN